MNERCFPPVFLASCSQACTAASSEIGKLLSTLVVWVDVLKSLLHVILYIYKVLDSYRGLDITLVAHH